MARKGAESLDHASLWALNAAGAPGSVSADDGFHAIRRNVRFFPGLGVHLGSAGQKGASGF